MRRTPLGRLIFLIFALSPFFLGPKFHAAAIPQNRAANKGRSSQLTAELLVSLAPRLSPRVAQFALNAASCGGEKFEQNTAGKLAIIDYSRPSSEKRFWLFDLATQQLLVEDLVAHGRNSGENHAASFSNLPGSLQSSLGLFKVGASYIGKHGNSLRLLGLEPGINDLAEQRAIVLHGADYVSPEFIRQHQRLGRSFGCPALSRKVASKVIDLFKEGKGSGFLFSYYPNEQWLRSSTVIKGCGA